MNLAIFFFNKTYNLCYGKFIGEFHTNCEIIAYKSPSCIKKVNYKQLAKALFKTSISDDAGMDTYCKKLVANVNFGLLEKMTKYISEIKHIQYLRRGEIPSGNIWW